MDIVPLFPVIPPNGSYMWRPGWIHVWFRARTLHGGSVFFHQAAGTHCPGPLSFGLALPALGKGSTPQLWGGGVMRGAV